MGASLENLTRKVARVSGVYLPTISKRRSCGRGTFVTGLPLRPARFARISSFGAGRAPEVAPERAAEGAGVVEPDCQRDLDHEFEAFTQAPCCLL